MVGASLGRKGRGLGGAGRGWVGRGKAGAGRARPGRGWPVGGGHAVYLKFPKILFLFHLIKYHRIRFRESECEALGAGRSQKASVASRGRGYHQEAAGISQRARIRWCMLVINTKLLAVFRVNNIINIIFFISLFNTAGWYSVFSSA